MSPRRILLTSFGYNDPGGGTTVPRVVSQELARRGWEVTVFHAAVAPDPSGEPYAVREWEQDGVRLIGVHNRPHGLFDIGNPRREIDDAPITRAFADALDRVRPDVVHVHNLHNLGAALLDEIVARGLPAYFSTHNYWLICPRAYLLTGQGEMCPGAGDRVGDCARCTGSHDVAGHRERLAAIRSRFVRAIDVCLAVSEAMRRTLVAHGYPDEMIDVVRQAVPAADAVWERLGRDRVPGRVGDELVVAFFGSAYPHKGPQLLVAAAQRMRHPVRVRICGEVPAAFAAHLRAMDRRGVVELTGAYGPDDLPRLLAEVDAAVMPSMWWDCAPLAAAECLAGRLPLVAPRLGGLAEAVRHERDGLLFDGLDADALAAALDRLAGEPGLLERLQAGIEPPRPFAEYVDELEAYYAGERPSRRPAGAGDGAVATVWVGDHTLRTSLSTINREVAPHLGDGVALRRLERDGRAHDAPLPHPAAVEVRHQWPPDLRPAPAGRLALIQPWEFGALPVAWLEPLRRDVDEVWVPSAYVRRMYLDAGVAPDRVHVVPNGVDLERFRPDGPRLELDAPDGLRLLFVGGAISRKGIDVLLSAYREAFAGRTDVALIVKDFGMDGPYRAADRSELERLARDGGAPRVVHLTRELDDAEMAALYRACDVLVHPYRGEGFAMPVLEAMASGLPVVVTAGGPTDEFCPDEAGWRIRSRRVEAAEARVGERVTDGRPWWLEPDRDHLVALLRAVDAAGPEERARRGAAGRAAARAYGWQAIGAAYAGRLRALAARPPVSARPDGVDAPFDWPAPAATRVLAMPAWRGTDRLAELLAAWAQVAPAGTDACLELLAGAGADPAALEAHVLDAAAAAGVDLDACADIDLLVVDPTPERDARLLGQVDAFVPLHAASRGLERIARAVGTAVLAPEADALRPIVSTVPVAAA
jgi:glycosyltransferase involved in cell wall biosynthesis